MSLRRLVLSAGVVALAACNNGSRGGALVRLDPEAAGANCPKGGIKVSTGVDANEDGALADDEVSASRYVCNGADGATGGSGVNAMSVVTAEPSGANCRYGGVRVDVGVDADGDGQLAPSEISSTRYLCDKASVDGIWFGSVSLSTAEDVAALAGIQHITGDLIIDGVDGGALSLPELVSVGGTIGYESWGEGTTPGLETLRSISLPALEKATTIDLWYAPSLTTLSLPKLARVGSLTVRRHPALTSIDLSSLARADWVQVSSNDVLPSLALPELAYVNRLHVSDNPLLAALATPKLTFVRDEVFITDNLTLSECAAWRVPAHLRPEADPSVVIFGNDEATSCAATDVCRRMTIAGVGGTLRACLRPLDFAAAGAMCQSLGAGSALAWVTSDAEWLALSAAALNGVIDDGWLGYSDSATEGTWVATSGFTGYDPTARTDFWNTGEPNGGTMENAAELTWNGRVSDSDATLLRAFLCRGP